MYKWDGLEFWLKGSGFLEDSAYGPCAQVARVYTSGG